MNMCTVDYAFNSSYINQKQNETHINRAKIHVNQTSKSVSDIGNFSHKYRNIGHRKFEANRLTLLMTVHNFQYTIQHRTVLIISPLTSRQSVTAGVSLNVLNGVYYDNGKQLVRVVRSMSKDDI